MPVPKTRKTPSKKSAKGHQSTVNVYLRLRPLKLEESTIVKIDDRQVEAIPPDGGNSQIFQFTKVFDNVSQSKIFDNVARPMVEDFIGSKDGLIFTYGITGSGKTYTMEGTPSDPGMVYRTMDFVFNSVGPQLTKEGLIANNGHNEYFVQRSGHIRYPNPHLTTLPSVARWSNRAKEQGRMSVDSSARYCVFMSLIDLYNKQICDLLDDSDRSDKRRSEIRTDPRGMSYVANITEQEVRSADEAVQLYADGVRRRKTGSTALNQESSRGHCVLILKLVRAFINHRNEYDPNLLVVSQLCLVDLAGSERTKRSKATGGALQEACNINNSLGALRKCIRALRDGVPNANIQYRDYSLTRLFKTYFEGHGSVRMVLCVKPSPENFKEDNIAMEFGLLTQEVAVDYASPVKMLRTLRDDPEFDMGLLKEFMDRKRFELNPNMGDIEFIDNAREQLLRRREERKRLFETINAAQAEHRKKLVADENAKSAKIEAMRLENDTLRAKLEHITLYLENQEEHRKRVRTSSPTVRRTSYHTPKPIETPNPSTPTISSTPPTTTNSSVEYREEEPTAPAVKSPVLSPGSVKRGVPVANPRFNRSLSTSSIKWIHHKPPGTVDTGTVWRPKLKNAKCVKNLRSSDLLSKDIGGYAVTHQQEDTDGELESSTYKFKIIPTRAGGIRAILEDKEIMYQEGKGSPLKRRRRALSDAH